VLENTLRAAPRGASGSAQRILAQPQRRYPTCGFVGKTPAGNQSFFASFCSQKEVLSFFIAFQDDFFFCAAWELPFCSQKEESYF
jgi:hypothetical protein